MVCCNHSTSKLTVVSGVHATVCRNESRAKDWIKRTVECVVPGFSRESSAPQLNHIRVFQFKGSHASRGDHVYVNVSDLQTVPKRTAEHILSLRQNVTFPEQQLFLLHGLKDYVRESFSSKGLSNFVILENYNSNNNAVARDYIEQSLGEVFGPVDERFWILDAERVVKLRSGANQTGLRGLSDVASLSEKIARSI